MHTYSEIGAVEARLAIDTCVAELTARGKAGVIAVGDRHGELIALWRMDGGPLPSLVVATNKVFTASRKAEPTGNLGRDSRAEGWDIVYFGDSRYIGWDGGVPVIFEGKCVGSVAVSGLSGEEDQEIAQKAVSRILEHLASEG